MGGAIKNEELLLKSLQVMATFSCIWISLWNNFAVSTKHLFLFQCIPISILITFNLNFCNFQPRTFYGFPYIDSTLFVFLMHLPGGYCPMLFQFNWNVMQKIDTILGLHIHYILRFSLSLAQKLLSTLQSISVSALHILKKCMRSPAR